MELALACPAPVIDWLLSSLSGWIVPLLEFTSQDAPLTPNRFQIVVGQFGPLLADLPRACFHLAAIWSHISYMSCPLSSTSFLTETNQLVVAPKLPQP